MKVNIYKRINTNRTVFIKHKSIGKQTIGRQLALAALMLTSGTSILYYINLIPNRLEWFDRIKEVFPNLMDAIIIIFKSMLVIAEALLLIISIIIGLLLLMGGLIRLIRIFLFSKKHGRRNK